MFQCLGEILPQAAKKFGLKTALIVEDRQFSFVEMEALSNKIANGLTTLGVAPGERVTLYGPNCWEWLVAYYGVAKTGAVVIPINVMLTPEEVRFIVQNSGARAIIAASESGEPLMDMKGGALADVILWGDNVPTGATSFNDFLERGKPNFNVQAVASSSPGAICYTSGTTGHPKGAIQSHRAVLGSAAGTSLMSVRTVEDTVVSPLPLPHVYGSCVFNGCFMYGATFVMVPRFAEEAVLEAVQSNNATVMDGVPTAYYYLLAHRSFDNYDLSSLTRCTVGGQTLPAAKSIEFRERSGAPVLELWGMTELSGAATANPFYGENKPGTIGLPMPGSLAKIVDVNDPAKELGPGERGELMFKGPLVMDGYFNNEAATVETILPDGWLHTGDIATVDEDGYYTIVDRKKDMILTAGYNVYPAELERVLCMHPSIALAAVCGVSDEVKGELAKAYVMLKPDTTASGQELVDHCRQHLAVYKVPRSVQFVEQVPITSSGKIMRRLLKDIDDGSRGVD